MNERILITVKTYPTLSQKYGELVCTAGLRENGSWVRLYPIQFCKLDRNQEQYHKYQWLTADINRRSSDPRPESYSPNIETIKLGETIPPTDGWAERCRIVLGNGPVHNDMSALIELANANTLSLATYKPSEVLDLCVEKVDREWDSRKVRAADGLYRQGDLFAEDNQLGELFTVVDKLPYRFSYRFKDKNGKERTLMIEDWEIGALFWNCLRDADGAESIAIDKVKQKYLDTFVTKTDLHLFVGTTKRYHGWASNPFVIIGTFTPPKGRHAELPLWS